MTFPRGTEWGVEVWEMGLSPGDQGKSPCPEGPLPTVMGMALCEPQPTLLCPPGDFGHFCQVAG